MWMVQLSGDTSDLATLSQSLTGTDINVLHDGHNYVLKSDRSASIDEAGKVHQEAENMIDIINGASHLALNITECIRVGAVYQHREDGGHDTFIFPEPGVIRLRSVAPTVTISRMDGTVEEIHPADPVK